MMEKKLHVFDMDDTLLYSPGITSFVKIENGNVISDDPDTEEYFNKIKAAFYILFYIEIGFVADDREVLVYNKKNNEVLGDEYLIYTQEIDNEKFIQNGFKPSFKKNFLRRLGSKNGKLKVNPQPSFYQNIETVGSSVNAPVVEYYNKAKNVMIVTGRDQRMKEQVEKRLFDELKLKIPNYGLYLFDRSGSVKEFKARVIKKSIEENSWQEIHLFEDRADWIDFIRNEVVSEYPNIIFISHLVKEGNIVN